MNFRTTLIAAAVAAGALTAQLAFAADFGTAKEAEALLAKAVAHVKAVGKEKAFADFTEKKPGWTDRDLYVNATRGDGIVVAHGSNAKLVGRNLLDFKDADGKEFVREIVTQAKAKERYTVDLQFSDPVTRKILPKTLFCERVDDTALCVGIYKRT